MEDLKPCPFCGSGVELIGEENMVWAVCSNNNCCMAEHTPKFDEPEDAIEKWNERILPKAYGEEQKTYGTGSAFRRIDDLGRIAIPKDMRKKLQIDEGDMLEVIQYPRGIYIKMAERS
jgi:AbrB family looped-hinge helix DNA binding protein